MLKSDDTPEKKVLLHCPKCNNEFPAQGRERYVQIVDVVRNNQHDVAWILLGINSDIQDSKDILNRIKKMDRDAILQHGGILTDKQIELLK